ncbi:4'-phosphopantetheinyl transferase family protein [Phocaeicola sp.]
MPLFRKYQQGELLVGVWKMDETTEQLLSLFDHPAVYEEGAKKYTSDARKHEWLAVRVLLKTLCGSEKEIAYYPSGKPYLKTGAGFISISHTRGYVAVALHPACEVGIDIEQYGERVRKVASRFIRPDEEPTIQCGNEVYALLLHWSAKETLFKVMGAEGVDFIRHLHILPFTPAGEGVFEACEYRTEQQCHYHIHYLTHSDFVLTWTVK